MINPRQSKSLRITLLAIILVLSVPALAPLRQVSAQGDGTPKLLSVQVGFDGYCKQDKWLPIHVEVENTGADLDATVRVSYTNSNNGITSTSVEVPLPSTSRKEFFLYIYPQGFLRNFNVSLLDGKQVRDKRNLSVNCLTSENMLIGVLADNPSTYNILNDIKPITGFARVAHLNISDLPEKAQAWDSLGALIISNVDTGTLTPGQKQALESWLGFGGKLLVTGGPRWQGTVAGLKDFMPVDITGVRNVSGLSALQAYLKDSSPLDLQGTVLSVGTIRDGANVLVEQDGVPLLVQKSVGFGTVYYFAADPSLKPLSGWSGNQDLYTLLLGSQPTIPKWSNGSWYGFNANQALGAIAELGLPSILYISCLMGMYVFIIGPLNYFVLHRIKRRELAWVTIPALVIVFSFLAYGSGLFYRGTTPILNRLVVAQAWDGVAQARTQALVGIYSPVRAKYDLDSTEHFLPQPFAGGNGDLQPDNNWTAVQEGSDTILPEIRVEIGGMKAMALEGSLPALPISHDLVLSIGRANPIVSGTITNQSKFTMRDVILITPGGWTKLGDLAPNKSRQSSVSLAPNGNGPEFYTVDPMTILNLGYDDIQRDVDAARRYSLLQNVLAPDYQRNDGNWGIYLMGWVDQPVLPVGLKDKRSKTVDTMLYIHKLTPAIKLEDGELKLPVSLFAWESSMPSVSPYYGQLSSGEYELRFTPGIPLHYRSIKSMDFLLTSNALPNELIAYAWNYEVKDWVQISYGTYYTNVPEPEPFVGPNGDVRIKVVVNRSDWTEIRGSHIQLVVEP